ncbi:AAA family ATPase [Dongia sp.]|uniref:AAA family ATPase n=1 Tax=Dongia sp. TaxID=1977262 RepID=UPI0035B3F9CB
MRRTPERQGLPAHLAYRLKRPLSWWRHTVLLKMGNEDLPRFQRALEQGSKGKLTSEQIQRALHDGDVALQVALELHPGVVLPADDLADLAISWAAMAVHLGKKVAALLVAEALRQNLERLDAQPWQLPVDATDISRMRRRMHAWFDIFPINNAFLEAREGVGLLGHALGHMKIGNGHSLIPVRSIPGGGKWGREIALRYEGLTKPLPLKLPQLSPDHLEMKLHEEMPSFASVTAAIADDLRFQMAGTLPIARFRPLLLLGRPGIGKTRYVRRLAFLLRLPFRMIAGAGAQTPDLTGLSRIYDSTQAGVVPRTMLETGIANPILLVDEIDKARALGREVRLQDALLAMIDSETARRVPDECLASTVDMSCVSWILTANDVGGLSSPLLDRVRVFNILPPESVHLPRIIQGMLEDIAMDFHIPPEEMPELPEQTMLALVGVYRAGASVRVVKRALIAAVSVAMRSLPDH